jgi:hypothetical protein
MQINGVCSTDLRLDTSTNGFKHVYIRTQEIYEKTYFVENVHLNIIYNFYITSFCLKQTQHFKMAFLMSKIAL